MAIADMQVTDSDLVGQGEIEDEDPEDELDEDDLDDDGLADDELDEDDLDDDELEDELLDDPETSPGDFAGGRASDDPLATDVAMDLSFSIGSPDRETGGPTLLHPDRPLDDGIDDDEQNDPYPEDAPAA